MALSDKAKEREQKSGNIKDRQEYCKLRNYVTKLNQKKKKQYYTSQINQTKNDSKKLWSTLNSIMGRKSSLQPTYIDCGGTFITKPKEIANHLNDYFRSMIYKLRKELSHGTDNSLSITHIKKYMENK